MLPELLALNSSGHPNGHTPYSAYLALAALLAGYLGGNPMVLAGNSRSDDEPNVADWHGMPVNHQWTRSHEFEAALGQYCDRWLPGTPLYSSPLRPLLELQIIGSLAPHMEVRSAIQAAGRHDAYLPALSTCLHNPAVQDARPLDMVLKDWGQDDLLPEALKARVRRAAHL